MKQSVFISNSLNKTSKMVYIDNQTKELIKEYNKHYSHSNLNHSDSSMEIEPDLVQEGDDQMDSQPLKTLHSYKNQRSIRSQSLNQ